jgi:xanthine dehydrogenase molybdenum-binding subunit
MPPIEVLLVESPEPKAPYGIKGVGEIGLVPTAGAVAAALHDLDGVFRSRLPMKPSARAKRAVAAAVRSEPASGGQPPSEERGGTESESDGGGAPSH